jgi:hypothetical protein
LDVLELALAELRSSVVPYAERMHARHRGPVSLSALGLQRRPGLRRQRDEIDRWIGHRGRVVGAAVDEDDSYAEASGNLLAAELAELAAAADEYAAAAQAENTSRAYASDWRQFETWCDRYRLQSLPAAPAVVALYLTSLAKRGLTVSTVRRRAAVIARAHRQAGHVSATSDPSVLTVLEGIARVHGAAPNKKTALLREPLLELVDRIDVATTDGLATARFSGSASRSGSDDPNSSP